MVKNIQPYNIKTITEYHDIIGLPKPNHPLISVINFDDIKYSSGEKPKSLTFNFYSIALKKNFNGKIKYGQQEYDFDEGLMVFISPEQVLSVEVDENLRYSGCLLIFHPDLLWGTSLAKVIKQYEYFEYSVNEALFLSDKEELMITNMIKSIEQEYSSNVDKFSQNVIIAQIELLLIYAQRFYNRQFITRKTSNNQILNNLEVILKEYFASNALKKDYQLFNILLKN